MSEEETEEQEKESKGEKLMQKSMEEKRTSIREKKTKCVCINT